MAYEIGDRIDNIEGRDINLRENVPLRSRGRPIYPSIVGISWTFHGEQATHLTLSDVRPQPPPERTR